jgi:hypothetical protein
VSLLELEEDGDVAVGPTHQTVKKTKKQKKRGVLA